MSYDRSNIEELYSSDEYLEMNPNLHQEDSAWKITKILPLIDKYLMNNDLSTINLLDVGGGAGIIMKEVASYIEKKKEVKVRKYALDLSPGMLKAHQQNNPDLVKVLNEDITKTSLHNKEIDLTLMIDVLEHLPKPVEALRKLQQISKYILFKVPLEDNLVRRVWNFVQRGKLRRDAIEKMGHINLYRYSTLEKQLQANAGQIVDSFFTNLSDYHLSPGHFNESWSFKIKLMHMVSRSVFKLSPKINSMLFGDFAMVLVKCHD